MKYCARVSTAAAALIAAVLFAIAAMSCAAAVWFVAPESDPARQTHDGTAWATAYAAPQDALSQAAAATKSGSPRVRTSFLPP